jgi:hypothetical protein
LPHDRQPRYRPSAVLRRAGFHRLPRLALQRFARVETVGFDYGQRHAVELAVRGPVRDAIAKLRPEWPAVSVKIMP